MSFLIIQAALAAADLNNKSVAPSSDGKLEKPRGNQPRKVRCFIMRCSLTEWEDIACAVSLKRCTVSADMLPRNEEHVMEGDAMFVADPHPALQDVLGASFEVPKSALVGHTETLSPAIPQAVIDSGMVNTPQERQALAEYLGLPSGKVKRGKLGRVLSSALKTYRSMVADKSREIRLQQEAEVSRLEGLQEWSRALAAFTSAAAARERMLSRAFYRIGHTARGLFGEVADGAFGRANEHTKMHTAASAAAERRTRHLRQIRWDLAMARESLEDRSYERDALCQEGLAPIADRVENLIRRLARLPGGPYRVNVTRDPAQVLAMSASSLWGSCQSPDGGRYYLSSQRLRVLEDPCVALVTVHAGNGELLGRTLVRVVVESELLSLDGGRVSWETMAQAASSYHYSGDQEAARQLDAASTASPPHLAADRHYGVVGLGGVLSLLGIRPCIGRNMTSPLLVWSDYRTGGTAPDGFGGYQDTGEWTGVGPTARWVSR